MAKKVEHFENVGLVWTPESLRDYLKGRPRPAWCKGITLHHTGAPSLATRPKGLLITHIHNMRDYYKTPVPEIGKGSWGTGPHLFVDEDQGFGMTPFEFQGTHARSFNATHIGIEVLGDYDSEQPGSGRGLECWTNAVAFVRVLLDWLNLPTSAVNFHRNDPKTPKTCPGTRVTLPFVVDMLSGRIAAPTRITGPDFEWLRVATFLEKNGKPLTLLHAENGMVFLGDTRLERVRYDKDEKATFAGRKELEDWLARQ